jgi:imidazolonepropionase-like amidohydrolase
MPQDHVRNIERLNPEGEAQFSKKISPQPTTAPAASVIDCGKRASMPGLIGSHVRVVLSELSLPRLETIPLTLMTVRAAVPMRSRLDRDFTSVRATGGADWGLKRAADKWRRPANLLIVEGNPLRDLGVLQEQGTFLAASIKGGRFHKNRLH